ncbi:MAG: nuA3 HAT complex component nto1 [Peltula sp. TS41687]|nr:MAG: nuA3 HAT complex component nto1 [Peltula sp. TS41687]
MAPLTQNVQTPSTGRKKLGRPFGSTTVNRASTNGLTDPPLKKRKYVPGGPGGGGRYIEIDGSETPVGGTGPGGPSYSGPPRARTNGVISVSPSTSLRKRETTSTAVALISASAAIPRTSAPSAPMPRFSSAAAAAAAVVQGDGYKPREEKGWEEIHPHLDIEAKFAVYSAEEVDGRLPNTTTTTTTASPHLTPGGEGSSVHSGVNGVGPTDGNDRAVSPSPGLKGGGESTVENTPNSINSKRAEIVFAQPKKRRPGRPTIKRPEPPITNGTPVTPVAPPKIIPPPGPNPREKLTLPKPSFRRIDPFEYFEQKGTGQTRYVDRSMANVGYQETDFFMRPESTLIRFAEGSGDEDLDLIPALTGDGDGNTALGGAGVGRVEYDMDEQDDEWLAAHNDVRKSLEVEPITREVFEITMTKIEKEWYALEKRIPKPNPKPPQTQRPRSGSANAVNGEPPGAAGEEQDSKCAICDDGDCENTNAIVFCDGCDLAVHQECYGVPFIPEGQWLCRKCQLIGRATSTCIFCPNTDGAFKQTNSSRWSHLLCAIWIPEISLGNTTFMEPVMDVEKVPKQRWKLTCYICRQKMGACVQCGNKNCFVAFHVTCARRARLFLKMKSAHGGPANIDASVLKAYCDKHVPADWRRENDVDAAVADAQDFYHHTMKGRLWADSQQSALASASSPHQSVQTPGEENNHPPMPRLHLTVGGNKRKANQRPKLVWKLPSGAPVIPQVVYSAVETSLQRFMVRKRKEYVAEACKYWTLKREARRGAALLKRLQLQMETFSSMEVTRRNYAGMGAAGRVRLQRRSDFATKLLKDLERLRLLCDEVKKREREKLRDAEMLRDIVDTVYCPISALLWPILERAQSLDGKGVFRDGFAELRSKLEARCYTSVSQFSRDFRAIFSSALGSENAPIDDPTMQEDLATIATVAALTSEQKELRKLAKRIIKAVQGHLEGAVQQEAELGGKPFEKELRELDLLLDNGIFSRRESTVPSFGEGPAIDMETTEGKISQGQSTQPSSLPNGHVPTATPHESATQGHSVMVIRQHSVVVNSTADSAVAAQKDENANLQQSLPQQPATAAAATMDGIIETQERTTMEGVTEGVNGIQDPVREPHQPAGDRTLQQSGVPTPPLSSSEDLLAPLTYGGIPWYMEPFDPVGTTIHEERWTGREVVRGMSEELSELDEEELRGLVDEDMDAQPKEPTPPPAQPVKRIQPRGEKGRFKSMKSLKKK